MDVEPAVEVYERSNLARRGGAWPSRSSRLAHVTSNLRREESWFFVAQDGNAIVGMAVVLPFRADRGAGGVVPRTSFLDLIYVEPNRWGEGIGGSMLDAVIGEARRRGSERIYLWTHERDNERAHRLYTSRSFRRTGVIGRDDADEPTAEWVSDG